MRATGIVRRIDDLGRIVIPKEIRRQLRLREGDLMEIFTDREGRVIFQKYIQNQLAETIQDLKDILTEENINNWDISHAITELENAILKIEQEEE